ncbi:MAG: hypothetical protein K0M40_11535 [Prolixibacteraceae bacterium]|nr:hypothetical protein [Prolixibacteraceae bacterium]
MKTQKKYDSVKMMRDIREKIDSEIINMTPAQILEYIKKGRIDYEKIMAGHQPVK